MLYSLRDGTLKAFKINCPAIFQVMMVSHRLQRKGFSRLEQGGKEGGKEGLGDWDGERGDGERERKGNWHSDQLRARPDDVTLPPRSQKSYLGYLVRAWGCGPPQSPF